MKGSSREGFALSAKKRELLEALLRDQGVESQDDGIPRRKGTGPAPLSFAQQRLWFFDQYEPGSTAYNLPAALRLEGPLDVSALERAFNEMVRRHEALRTTFALREETPVQIVHEPEPLDIEILDLRELASDVRNLSSHRIADEQARQPFDLSTGPLFVLKLLRLDDEDYVLVITMHHIVSDGWSIKVFIREIGELYGAYSSGVEPRLPELPIQYADFAEWQRERLQGAELDKHLDYWRTQLSAAPGTLELPWDRPRPPFKTSTGSVLPFKLPPALSAGLSDLSRREGATIFMTFLAALNVLLYRYSWQEDILVGSPIANRNRTEVESLLGFFVNTLVIRTDLSGGPTFRELLGRVRNVALEAYAHQDLPFEKLVEELQPERSLSQTPLFQVLFHMQNALAEDLKLARVRVTSFAIEDDTAKFDLSLTITEGESGPSGSFNYNADLFDRATIERMSGHLGMLIESILDDPDQKISRLSLLRESERDLVLRDWNATKADYPDEHSVAAIFEQQVHRRPDATAVVFDQQISSYGELNRRSNQLARCLRELGVGLDTVVGICLEREPEMIIAMLAALKAGGAYMPLDPEFPGHRLKTMIDTSEAGAIVTRASLLDRFPSGAALSVCLDEDSKRIASYSTDNLPKTCGAEGLVYVMYTSGSTGVPKGIGITHRGVIRLLFGTNYAELGRNHVLLQLASPGFDASTFELWGALLHGGVSVLMDGRTATVDEIQETIEKNRVDTAWLTSSLFNSVIDENPQALSPVKQLLIGGEALSTRHVIEAQRLLPGTQIVNGYGPTEGTTFTCCHKLGHETADYFRGIPIGAPIANTRVYILDGEMNPAPIGVIGEIYVGGDGLARGYVGQPDLTAGAFLPGLGDQGPGERFYRTGDLGRHRTDGTIEFTGRIDHQIKLRGYRIEPQEIEAAMSSHPSVKQCVVDLRVHQSGAQELAAYVVPAVEADVSSSELRSYIEQRLPHYMIPSSFLFMEALPLTPNGKVDRKALPEPGRRRTAEDRAFVPPGNPVEEVIAAMVAEVLSLDSVGVDDNFFELGGHSLTATLLVGRMRKAFLVDLPLKKFFEGPTVAALSKIVLAERGKQAEKIAALLKEIEGLPIDRVEELLAKKEQEHAAKEAHDGGRPDPLPD